MTSATTDLRYRIRREKTLSNAAQQDELLDIEMCIQTECPLADLLKVLDLECSWSAGSTMFSLPAGPASVLLLQPRHATAAPDAPSAPDEGVGWHSRRISGKQLAFFLQGGAVSLAEILHALTEESMADIDTRHLWFSVDNGPEGPKFMLTNRSPVVAVIEIGEICTLATLRKKCEGVFIPPPSPTHLFVKSASNSANSLVLTVMDTAEPEGFSPLVDERRDSRGNLAFITIDLEVDEHRYSLHHGVSLKTIDVVAERYLAAVPAEKIRIWPDAVAGELQLLTME